MPGKRKACLLIIMLWTKSIPILTTWSIYSSWNIYIPLGRFCILKREILTSEKHLLYTGIIFRVPKYTKNIFILRFQFKWFQYLLFLQFYYLYINHTYPYRFHAAEIFRILVTLYFFFLKFLKSNVPRVFSKALLSLHLVLVPQFLYKGIRYL